MWGLVIILWAFIRHQPSNRGVVGHEGRGGVLQCWVLSIVLLFLYCEFFNSMTIYRLFVFVLWTNRRKMNSVLSCKDVLYYVLYSSVLRKNSIMYYILLEGVNQLKCFIIDILFLYLIGQSSTPMMMLWKELLNILAWMIQLKLGSHLIIVIHSNLNPNQSSFEE